MAWRCLNYAPSNQRFVACLSCFFVIIALATLNGNSSPTSPLPPPPTPSPPSTLPPRSLPINLQMVFISKGHTFLRRKYLSYLQNAIESVNRNTSMSFHGRYIMSFSMAGLNEFSPKEVFRTLCDNILNKSASLIFYLSEVDSLEYKAASAEYLLQIANFLGLPAIVWAEDNSGVVQPNPESTILQLTPSILHQGQAMVGLLKRYNWVAFGVVTGSLAGHELFINSLHRLTDSPDENTERIDILVVIKILWSENTDHVREQLVKLNKSETRVILLYASHRESERILQVAKEMGQTGKDFIWIMCKTSIGERNSIVPVSFYPGLLGLGRQVETNNVNPYREKGIKMAVMTWAHGIDRLFREQPNASLVPQDMNCSSGGVERRWKEGHILTDHMKNLSIMLDEKTPISFNEDGTMKHTELKILNLDENSQWQEIGDWSSEGGLQMGDITWPGGAPTPPKGRPPKYHIRLVTLQEKPYVFYSDPDPVLGTCPPQSELCRIAPLNVTKQFSNATTNPALYQCCSGLCIDLLKLLSEKISFDFELFEVPDKKWGAFDPVHRRDGNAGSIKYCRRNSCH